MVRNIQKRNGSSGNSRQGTAKSKELGGAESHASRSGVTQFVYDSEEECLAGVRRLLGFIPGNNLEDPPAAFTGDSPTR